jgi:hypothetical protein
MHFITYSTLPLENFLPIEHVVTQACEVVGIKDNFIRTIFALQNKSNGALYLHSESLARWPLGKEVARISGLFQGYSFEFFFECGWASGTVGGPDKALLKDKNGKIYARTEKVYCKPDIKSKDLIIRQVHTLHMPNDVYRLQLKEYPSSVGFFDINGFPKRELELYNSDGIKCIWAGVRKPGRKLKVFQAVDNMHILLSLFVSLHIPFTFYRYP